MRDERVEKKHRRTMGHEGSQWRIGWHRTSLITSVLRVVAVTFALEVPDRERLIE